MNYASDALWWRLQDPAVRDLAAVLTAPPLWHSGREVTVAALLGRQGFRFLLALDDEPLPLYRHLAQEAPFGRRLGRYAESLLAFWLARAPHSELVARNLPLADADGRSLGEADFLCRLDGTAWHLELCCKYYGGGTAADFCGLNAADRLNEKADKLQQQLCLLQRPEFAAAYPPYAGQAWRSGSVVRGVGFSADGALLGAPLNPYGWSGRLVDDWRAVELAPQQRFYPLPRTAYLAPARVAQTEVLTAEAMAEQGGGLAAIVACRPDGMWHEEERLMCRR
ncbi:MAG: DUF1853 family protein [Eikenella sp.]|nr:DUF1853 family protein [Eikenella sp.]